MLKLALKSQFLIDYVFKIDRLLIRNLKTLDKSCGFDIMLTMLRWGADLVGACPKETNSDGLVPRFSSFMLFSGPKISSGRQDGAEGWLHPLRAAKPHHNPTW